MLCRCDTIWSSWCHRSCHAGADQAECYWARSNANRKEAVDQCSVAIATASTSIDLYIAAVWVTDQAPPLVYRMHKQLGFSMRRPVLSKIATDVRINWHLHHILEMRVNPAGFVGCIYCSDCHINSKMSLALQVYTSVDPDLIGLAVTILSLRNSESVNTTLALRMCLDCLSLTTSA